MLALARRLDGSRITALFMMMVMLLAPLLAACEDDAFGGASGGLPPYDGGIYVPDTPAGPDTLAPVPGTVTASNPTSSTVDLSWSAATDDVTPAADLEYRVFYSLTDDIDSVADVLANGTAASEWQKNVTSLTVKSLALEMPYYFNVLVRDKAQNTAVYGGASAATLGGGWQAEELVDDYTGGAVYYSRLAVSPKGDVAAYWARAPEWELAVAVRPHDADTFGPAAAWKGVPRFQTRFEYGFGSSLMGPVFRQNEDETFDLLLASSTGGAAVTLDPIAPGLVNVTSDARVCVAANGDVMLAWIDYDKDYKGVVRARFRTASGWGSTSVVSASENGTFFGLEVACSPDGNHLVVYGDESVTPRTLLGRVYDAALGDWKAAATPLGDRVYYGRVVTARTATGKRYVAWEEHDDETSTSYFMVRSFDGTSWSEPDTLASGSLYDLSLTAAADDVHALWMRSTDNQLVTRRLAAGASTWSTETPLGELSSVQALRVSGSRFGDALAAWFDDTNVMARAYSPATQTWGDVVTLTDGPVLVGHGSLDCILDPRRRATVVWTEYDSDAEILVAKARTFR